MTLQYASSHLPSQTNRQYLRPDSSQLTITPYRTSRLARPYTSSNRQVTPLEEEQSHSSFHPSHSNPNLRSTTSSRLVYHSHLFGPDYPAHSNHSLSSFNLRSGSGSVSGSGSGGRSMTAVAGAGMMMDIERTRGPRRERTFVGSECAVCEEPLEHTLRGERVLQLSCGHVSHEACFYEFIKEFEAQCCPTCSAPLGLDSSRGGNVLDLEKLSNIVRSVSVSDSSTHRGNQNTPTPWDINGTSSNRPLDTLHHHDNLHNPQLAIHHNRRHSRDTNSQRERIERLRTPSTSRHPHSRSDSGTSGPDSYNNIHHHHHSSHNNVENTTGRRHDYDVQAMESDLLNLSPRPGTTSLSITQGVGVKNPIPAPTVTVRSEFPTICRSRTQQALTCLVTVEVPGPDWGGYGGVFGGGEEEVGGNGGGSGGGSGNANKQGARGLPVHYEAPEVLEEITEQLRVRVENWHGLDFQRFGNLKLHGVVRVGKDRASWQELECYLFAEMLICVKEKKNGQNQFEDPRTKRKLTRCTLKGSILIKKHLKDVDSVPEEPILTLNLSVAELPCFHLQFQSRNQLELWRRALLDLHNPDADRSLALPRTHNQDYNYDLDNSGTEEDDYRTHQTIKRVSSTTSSYGGGTRSNNTALTDYTNSIRDVTTISTTSTIPPTFHIPLDLVVVIPVSLSMQGLKISLLRDTLRFLVANLGPRDRMGLVTFGSSCGGVPLVGMTTKMWGGWPAILGAIRPVGQKSLRADVVEGANVAMDLLMQRRSSNPIATILLISDSSMGEGESVDFVVSRAEAAKVGIHSFGLGLTHKPDTMIELSTRTKASYTYVKDWMMLRECVAGCLGLLQSTSHQNVKLKLRLPEGSPAKFVKISGALHTTKRAAGRDAEAALGDLRFGDKRDILVQLVIAPDTTTQEHLPQDPWESIVSGLEALSGPLDSDDQRTISVEEVPLLQADLTYGDILRDGHLTHSPRPSLLAITMLPTSQRKSILGSGRPTTPPIPPHPSIVQRRMELLTSDMLSRALTLVSRSQQERAQHLLTETRSILKGLGKGGLPPLPQRSNKQSGNNSSTNSGFANATSEALTDTTGTTTGSTGTNPPSPRPSTSPSPRASSIPPPPPHSSTSTSTSASTPSPSPPSSSATITPTPSHPHPHTIDPTLLTALDTDLDTALEWINHPAVFGRDSRKAVLQAIGVISSQRGCTFRTPSEAHWAERVEGVRRMTERSREWREREGGVGGIVGEGVVAEE
ncbi:uncharacterized protein PADG_02058 [Paracoccidioides brasiliensis Pb18]|uniref:RING-type domain-containing protein n=1 Tax=Paracoccidioides brasiliensis (strain Pb18) TaxID=502780 RepID=C1G542_PARBD|nr:uncharacterized protein PADG_02058 [Paracoccidioides brasiliensis Pb18]EEH45908.2 hypothetical protein PADG_02058 [Paracoccidioides brasiliensis Pb18]